MRMVDTDELVEHMLRTYGTITVVGASATATKAAHSVPAHMQQHGWRIIPVNPHAEEILGEPVYRTLAEVPEQIGLVDVFRPSPETADVARQAVAAGAEALWLQLGIKSEEARSIAESAGMLYVEDRCLSNDGCDSTPRADPVLAGPIRPAHSQHLSSSYLSLTWRTDLYASMATWRSPQRGGFDPRRHDDGRRN
jgi:predicted CoA-binding protein